jgi:hypothetical protein
MTAKAPGIGDVVEVEWRDSERIDVGWDHRKKYVEHVEAVQSYRTAGYWMGRVKAPDGEHVLVVLNVDPSNGTISHAMSIPSESVRAVQVLGRADKRTRKALT